MAEIAQTADDKIWVNGKLVYRDSEGHWITSVELTAYEREAFQKHLNSIETAHNGR